MRTRLSRWLLLTGNRYAVASGVLVLMTGVVLVPSLTQIVIRSTDPLYYVASALITGNVTLITVVVAINQVTLSQELESPGSLRDEIEQTAAYRKSALGRSATATEPSRFLRQLVQKTSRHARSLDDLLSQSDGADRDRLLTDLPNHCERVSDRLKRASGSLAEVVIPILDADYPDYIHTCHQLQTKYDEEGHARLDATLERLTEDLENLDVARQYFTTTFIKEELATLSRSLLYIGVLAVSTPIALLVRLTVYVGPSPPSIELFVLTVLTTLVGLSPLALLIAFVLRVATIAQSIASITPFEA